MKCAWEHVLNCIELNGQISNIQTFRIQNVQRFAEIFVLF